MNPFSLLIARANDLDHADRAWHRMGSWEPGLLPSVMSKQVDMALALTREGADPVQLCEYDEVHVRRAEEEEREKSSFAAFKRRYGFGKD